MVELAYMSRRRVAAEVIADQCLVAGISLSRTKRALA
jgi:hypothetical protein